MRFSTINSSVGCKHDEVEIFAYENEISTQKSFLFCCRVVSPAGDLVVTPSILRRQQPSSRTSTMNRRHSFIMSKADEDDELVMAFDRNNVSKNFSFYDLTKNQDTEDDAVTLSSCSIESCHDVENSALPVSVLKVLCAM